MILAQGARGPGFSSQSSPYQILTNLRPSVLLPHAGMTLTWLLRRPRSLGIPEAVMRPGAYTRGGTRTRNLLLRREAPYPLGHTCSRCIWLHLGCETDNAWQVTLFGAVAFRAGDCLSHRAARNRMFRYAKLRPAAARHFVRVAKEMD